MSPLYCFNYKSICYDRYAVAEYQFNILPTSHDGPSACYSTAILSVTMVTMSVSYTSIEGGGGAFLNLNKLGHVGHVYFAATNKAMNLAMYELFHMWLIAEYRFNQEKATFKWMMMKTSTVYIVITVTLLTSFPVVPNWWWKRNLEYIYPLTSKLRR